MVRRGGPPTNPETLPSRATLMRSDHNGALNKFCDGARRTSNSNTTVPSPSNLANSLCAQGPANKWMTHDLAS